MSSRLQEVAGAAPDRVNPYLLVALGATAITALLDLLGAWTQMRHGGIFLSRLAVIS